MPVKTNITELIGHLDSVDTQIVASVGSGMTKGMREFEGHMIKTQFSGRPGLRRQSGNAARSWSVKTTVDSKGLVVRLQNAKRAFYVVVHQTGMTIRPKNKPYLTFKIGNKWIRTKKVKIPKRLNIPEVYKNIGTFMIKRAIERELRRVK